MSLLVDHLGRPMKARARKSSQPESAWGLYQTPRNTGEQDYYTEASWGLTDLSSALNSYDWTELIDLSRRLVAQLPILEHSIRQKADYAVGDAWIPQYRGPNPKWGEAAEDWVHNIWLPDCSHSGGCGDWQSDLTATSHALDIDGDDLALFVTDEDQDDFPRIAYRSAHQIGNGGGSGDVKGGWADGAKICNGIIKDRTGRFLGVRLLRPGRKSDKEPAFDDIPAHRCDLQFERFWRAQERGLPRPSCGLLDALDYKDIKKFMKRGVKLDSAQGITHYTESGSGNPNSDSMDQPYNTEAGSHNAPDVKIKKLYGGEIMYMRAGSQERIESFKSDRPAANAVAFQGSLERSCLLAVGWFRELVDPSAIGGASVRLIQDQARGSIRSRQKTLRKRAYRALYFALSQAMLTGRIPKNDSASDWMNWTFGLPAALTVDAGYDDQADERAILMGTGTLDGVSQKRGGYWQDNRAQRLIENRDLLEKAKALMTEANKGIEEKDRLSLRDAISLMQGSSNATGSPFWIMAGANSKQGQQGAPAKEGEE